MTSERQRRANVKNAQRSTGARTPEGKARSSMNAIRHGLTAKHMALTEDEQPEFEQLIDAYTGHFQPRDPIEADLVEELAMAKMRQRRAWRLEAAEIRIEIGRQEKAVAKDFPRADDTDRVTLAVEWLSDNGRTLDYLRRYEGQLRRAWHRCLEKLERKLRERPPAKQQNEPIPETGHRQLALVPKPQNAQESEITSNTGCDNAEKEQEEYTRTRREDHQPEDIEPVPIDPGEPER